MAIEFPATIELKTGSEPKKFKLDFDICGNPDCDCKCVSMVLYNEKKVINFFLDFATESYREGKYSEEEVEIIKAFIDFLKSGESRLDIGFFKKNYEYVKYKLKERQKAIESYNPRDFLKYNDILWDDEELKIEIKDRKYLILDTYCVMPSCNCRTVGLNFYEDVFRTANTIEPDFTFVYDYAAGTFKDAVGISDSQVEAIINIIPRSMDNKFKKRHVKLKKEVKKEIIGKIKEQGFVPKEAGKRKLGRNEPCHCGSGEKYKKCCLNKDIEKFGKAIKVSY